MNYSAIVLLLIGLGIAAIGFTGSQKIVCQSILGGNCDWLPGSTIPQTNQPTKQKPQTTTINFSSAWLSPS